MIESPVLDEVKEILRKRYEAEGVTKGVTKALRGAIRDALEARFGTVPEQRLEPVNALTDEVRLKALHRFAATCPDLDTFFAELTARG
jgi:hypothetical protein